MVFWCLVLVVVVPSTNAYIQKIIPINTRATNSMYLSRDRYHSRYGVWIMIEMRLIKNRD